MSLRHHFPGAHLGGFYNASAYTGVSLSLKNAASEAIPLDEVFPDKDTTPDYGICSMVSATDLRAGNGRLAEARPPPYFRSVTRRKPTSQVELFE